MLSNIIILLLVISNTRSQSNDTRNLKFPPGFLFGAGSSALQIEGAWNEDGKGENAFDDFFHRNPDFIVDHSTADVACDSYHLYKQDIPFIRMVEMNTYRFSLSWSRLLPTGDPNNVNQIAVDYYNLINKVLRYNLTPVIGWILNPVFGSGDYPLLVRTGVELRSLREGRKVSRLPKFTLEEILLIKGSADFLAINHYTELFASFTNHCPNFSDNRLSTDTDANVCPHPNYVTAPGGFMQVVPGSLRNALTQIRKRYNNPLVLITENGYPDSTQENLVSNPERERFFQSTLSDVFQSIEEGSNLMGYLVWSLLDSFEFNGGYTLKFGMVHVDFEHENKKRTAKPIVNFFRNFAEYGLNVTST